MKFFRLLFISTVALLLVQCQKDQFIKESGATLQFSADSIIFDTIFTTIGSTTAWLKVYNRHDKSINISSIEVAGGQKSFYRLNIDGHSGNSLNNKKIGPKDSLYVFIEVTIDPNYNNSPLVALDSIVFNTNGNVQDVKLVAWGQDVNAYYYQTIGTETWTADKPYLIYGNLVVDENKTLTIEPGTNIYMHKNASIVVLGTLNSLGETDNLVSIQGDRLEDFYNELSSQWGAVVFLPPSNNNVIQNTVIKNAIAGIQLGDIDSLAEMTLHLENTKILNSSYASLISYGGTVRAYNCVFAESGEYGLVLSKGGRLRILPLQHCVNKCRLPRCCGKT
ncbi:MAG: hypothetical protein HC896_11080, partial [Bacteroidales bacterium]|nr:hypothetical protein [Bacteroidales bacterium]